MDSGSPKAEETLGVQGRTELLYYSSGARPMRHLWLWSLASSWRHWVGVGFLWILEGCVGQLGAQHSSVG